MQNCINAIHNSIESNALFFLINSYLKYFRLNVKIFNQCILLS